MGSVVLNVVICLGALYTVCTLRSVNRRLKFLVEWVKKYDELHDGLSKDDPPRIKISEKSKPNESS